MKRKDPRSSAKSASDLSFRATATNLSLRCAEIPRRCAPRDDKTFRFDRDSPLAELRLPHERADLYGIFIEEVLPAALLGSFVLRVIAPLVQCLERFEFDDGHVLAITRREILVREIPRHRRCNLKHAFAKSAQLYLIDACLETRPKYDNDHVRSFAMTDAFVALRARTLRGWTENVRNPLLHVADGFGW